MNTYRIFLAVAGLSFLCGCSTIVTQVQKAAQLSSEVAKDCQTPPITTFGSTTSLRLDLQDSMTRAFGFGTKAPSDKGTSVPLALGDIQLELAKLSTVEQGKTKPLSVAIAALKKDSTTLQTSISTVLTNAQGGKASVCGKNSTDSSCVLDIGNALVNAANSMQEDVVALQADLKTFDDAVIKAERNGLASDQPTWDLIEADHKTVDQYSNAAFAIVYYILHPSTPGEEPTAVTFVKNAIDDEFQKYLAYEAATFSMNQIERVALRADKKLDEIDQKSWFIISLLSIAASSEFESSVTDELTKAKANELSGAESSSDISTAQTLTGGKTVTTTVLTTTQTVSVAATNKAMNFFNKVYFLDAVAAYSCAKLKDAGTNADTSRADVLMFPVYQWLILQASNPPVTPGVASNPPTAATTLKNLIATAENMPSAPEVSIGGAESTTVGASAGTQTNTTPEAISANKGKGKKSAANKTKYDANLAVKSVGDWSVTAISDESKAENLRKFKLALDSVTAKPNK